MRIYSEPEVAQILERAAERQSKAARAAPEIGLTLDDLERIAAETGLDPAHLRAAAAEVDAAGGVVERRSRSASHLFVERWVPGGLTDEGWDDLVSEVQNRFGKSGAAAYLPINAAAGRVEIAGRNREWVHTDGLGVETRVMASGRGDRTRLRVSQRVGMGNEVTDGAVVGLSAGVLGGLFSAAMLDLTGVWMVATITLVAVLVGLATYAFDVRWRRGKHDDLDDLTATLADLLARDPAPGLSSTAPALDLDALGVDPSETAVHDAQTRERS